MRIVVWVAALAIMGFLGVQLYNFYKSNSAMAGKLETAEIEMRELTLENEKFQADLSYFAEPENLAKELKTRFDYKKPGEKLIKIQ